MTETSRWLPSWAKGLLIIAAPMLMGADALGIAICRPRGWVVVLGGVATALACGATFVRREPWPTAALIALAGEVLVATDDVSRLRALAIVLLGAPALLALHGLFALRSSLLRHSALEAQALRRYASRSLRAGWLGLLLTPALLWLSWTGPTSPALGVIAVVVAASICLLLLWPERRSLTRGPQ